MIPRPWGGTLTAPPVQFLMSLRARPFYQQTSGLTSPPPNLGYISAIRAARTAVPLHRPITFMFSLQRHTNSTLRSVSNAHASLILPPPQKTVGEAVVGAPTTIYTTKYDWFCTSGGSTSASASIDSQLHPGRQVLSCCTCT